MAYTFGRTTSPAEDAEIASLLRSARTIAVVGLSSKRYRTSHSIAEYLQQAGYRIIPVNPNETEVLGERAYPTVAAIPERVDIVDVFRRPEHVPEVAEDAIQAGAKSLWMQMGIDHAEAAAQARAAGLTVVEDRCIMVDHRRLIGAPSGV